MATSQRGFAHIYLLVAGLAILVGIGSVGVLVAHHNTAQTIPVVSSPKKVTTKSSTSSTPKTTPAPTQTSTPAPTTTTSTQNTTPTTTSTPPSTPVVHPTQQDISQAQSNAYSIQTMLEAYWSNYNTYTWSLDAQDQQALENQPGYYQSSSGSPFDSPPGTSLSYQCLKGGGYSCTAYQLQALEANGTVIVTLNNLN
ncbi:MAG TPA: hypothetical protein VHB51_01315 [Candidatus Saccharimonadales bacterium]|nr:hypothetical protein [Candidatus Saccharimonadales bacterium]